MAERIDVCLVSKWFHPVLAGGAERFRRYAPGLRQRGVDLRVFTMQLHSELAPVETLEGVSVRRIPARSSAYLEYPRLLQMAVDNFRQSGQWPDVLQLFAASPRLVGDLWQARLHGTSTVLVSTMVRDDDNRSLARRWTDRLFTHWSLLAFQRIVTSSEVMASGFRQMGVPQRRIATIPNGVDVQRFRPPASAQERECIRSRLGFGQSDEVILFVGGIEQRKGVDTLVAAWPGIVQRRPRARLVLVGPRRTHETASPEKKVSVDLYCDEIDRMVAASPSSERVAFTEQVPNVEEYMRAADVFVFPSRREGMGNAVLEAMATGLPCVLTPYKGLPTGELGEAEKEFMLVERDPSLLAAVVSGLLEREDARAILGRAARRWAEAHLDVRMSLDSYARLYQSLAVGRGRDPCQTS